MKNIIVSLVAVLLIGCKATQVQTVNWEKSVFRGGGTHGEITMAYHFKKPIYLINQVPIDDLSSWIYSCSTEVFNSFGDLKSYMIKKYK